MFPGVWESLNHNPHLRPEHPGDALLSSMLIYRGVYYLLPLCLAASLLATTSCCRTSPW